MPRRVWRVWADGVWAPTRRARCGAHVWKPSTGARSECDTAAVEGWPLRAQAPTHTKNREGGRGRRGSAGPLLSPLFSFSRFLLPPTTTTNALAPPVPHPARVCPFHSPPSLRPRASRPSHCARVPQSPRVPPPPKTPARSCVCVSCLAGPTRIKTPASASFTLSCSSATLRSGEREWGEGGRVRHGGRARSDASGVGRARTHSKRSHQ